jgi:ABC-2 type transport system permease protein
MRNWVNRFLLAIALWPAGLYRNMGVNMIHLRAILVAKLTMDDRRAGSVYNSRNKKPDKEFNFATLLTMLACLLMGCVLLIAFVFESDVTRLTFYFTMYLFVLALFLIADFTDVLIDSRDNFILLPKPVNESTFLLARLLHIIIHISKIMIPIALPGFIGFLITRGIGGAVVLAVFIVLISLLTIFLVNAFYLLIIRIFSPEKFKSIIGAIQIGFTVFVFAAYQLLPRLIDFETMSDIDISSIGFMWLSPGFWFAQGWIQLYTWGTIPGQLIGLGLSVFTPVFAIWFVIKKLAPSFQQKIALIAGSGESTTIAGQPATGAARRKLAQRISYIMTSHPLERVSFLSVWHLTGRLREFKMRVYPQIGYIIVLLILFFFTGKKSMNLDDLDNPQALRSISLFIMYASGFLFLTALSQLPYTKQYRAAWMYFVAPLAKPGLVLLGASKALLVKFIFPTIILVGICGTILIGPIFLPNLLLGFGNLMLINAIISLFTVNKFPFSLPVDDPSASETTIKSFMRMLLLPMLGVPHYFIYNYPILVFFAGLLTTTAAYFVFRSMAEIKWKDISTEHADA